MSSLESDTFIKCVNRCTVSLKVSYNTTSDQVRFKDGTSSVTTSNSNLGFFLISDARSNQFNFSKGSRHINMTNSTRSLLIVNDEWRSCDNVIIFTRICDFNLCDVTVEDLFIKNSRREQFNTVR